METGAVPGGGIEVSSVRGAVIRGISSALEKGMCVCVLVHACTSVRAQCRVCGALHNYPLPHKHNCHSAKFPP